MTTTTTNSRPARNFWWFLRGCFIWSGIFTLLLMAGCAVLTWGLPDFTTAEVAPTPSNLVPTAPAPSVIPPTAVPPTAVPTNSAVPTTAPTAVAVQSEEVSAAIMNGRARMGYLITNGTFANFSEFVTLADADPAKVEAYENYNPSEDLYLYCSHYGNTNAWSATSIVDGWTGVWYAEAGEQVPTGVSCGGLPVSIFR